MRRTTVAAFALFASACGRSAAEPVRDASQPASAPPTASEMASTASSASCAPAGWVPSEMLSSDLGAGDRPPGSTAEARVLAWRIKQDERPLYVEEALVGAEVHPLSGPARWLVLHVFRHPRSAYGAEQRWRLAQIADTGVTGALRFDTAPPTTADIEALLAGAAWAEGLVGFKELSGGVCREAWVAH